MTGIVVEKAGAMIGYPGAKREAIDRFQKTGGMLPKGARLLGRWTQVDISGGFDLLEGEDPKP